MVDPKSVNVQELKELVCPYLYYCVRKQVPPPPSYSSEIYQQEIINKLYQSIENLIFNSKVSTDIITKLTFTYFQEIELNSEIDKDYESRETIVPKSKFEKFIWDLVNNQFKHKTAEQIYPIPKHVTESQKRKDKILIPISYVIVLGFLLIILYGLFNNR